MVDDGVRRSASLIRTPDQRVRVFVSSTLGELADERAEVRSAIESLRLTPVMFELGARPHPPRELYRAYLDQSDVFVGIYWERYGWIAEGEDVSGLEDEYRLAGDRPRLLYIKEPSERREPRLAALIDDFARDDRASYRRFSSIDELGRLVADDLALLLSERFDGASATATADGGDARRRWRTEVPAPLTATVGRDDDIDAVTGMLAAGRRLVTLTGPGGVGKTRLAVEVARRTERFGDGVVFVALQSADDPTDALHLVGERMGTRFEAADPLDSLAADLRGLDVLLVLDNVEQIEGLDVALAGLLERLPDLHVLVTSRRALRILGEVEYPVRSLPPPSVDLPASAIAGEPSVQLFVDRAREVSRDFELTVDNATDVAELIRGVDGLPLAIELAAARTRVLSPAELGRRMRSSLDVLRTSAPDLPERQRSLRATIDWSYDLLSEREQRLLADLSVFAGGWTLDAAERVCAGAAPADEMVDLLASLIDTSLVVVDRGGRSAEPRFGMLETIRVYAQERLAEQGRREEVAERHLAWLTELAHEAFPHLCGVGQREWVARMAPERPNIARAAAFATDRGDHRRVVELVWDVIVMYFVLDAVAEPTSWVRAVVAAEPPLDAVTDAKLRAIGALLRIHHGDYRAVRDDLEGALAVFRDHGMDFETAVSMHQIGFVRYQLDGDVPGAIAALEESSRLFDLVGHDWGVGLAQAMLGSVHAATGDLEAAERCQRHALERARHIASDQQVVQALGHLTLVRLLQGRAAEADDVLAESVSVIERGRFRTEAANALDAAAAVAAARGDHHTAAVAAIVAAAERARLGIEPWPTLQPLIGRTLDAVTAALGAAAIEDLRRRVAGQDVFDTLRDSVARSAAAALDRGAV